MESESSIKGGPSASAQESEYGWSVLASTLAHEIRNPLQTIKLELDFASRGGSLLKAVRKIAENISRLEAVVDRVQRLGQRHVVHPEQVNLAELVESVISVASFWLQAAGIEVRIHSYWEGAPLVVADKELLQQVFLNLLTNSIQAMPRGGKISIHLREAEQHAVAEVQDSGEGIPDSVMAMVGTPFFTTKKDGSGLGIAFCKTIAVLHGGSFELESKPGKGTRAIFRIRKDASDVREQRDV